MEQIILEQTKLNKFVRFGKSLIKGSVVFMASVIKDYPEFDGKKVFTSFEEIQKVVKTHKQFTVIENHVYDMFDAKTYKPKPIKRPIGTIKDLRAVEKCQCGTGTAYLNTNKIAPFLVNMLLRGGVLGISGGGRGGRGPGGHNKGENYDISQLNIQFHHMALVTHGIPKCPPNVCGFNISDSTGDNIQTAIKSAKSQAHAIAIAFSEDRKKLEIKEDLDLSSENAPESFKEYYDFLIFNESIVKENCVNDFYKEFKEAWNDLEGLGIKKDQEQSKSNKLNLLKKGKLNVTEELKAIIKQLQAENQTLKTTQLTDANTKVTAQNAVITDLDKKNKDQEKIITELRVITESIKQGEMDFIREALVKTGKYTPDEINGYSYDQLKKEIEMAARFNPAIISEANIITVPRAPMQMPIQQQYQYQPQFNNTAPIPQVPAQPGYSVMPIVQQQPYFRQPQQIPQQPYQPQMAPIPNQFTPNQVTEGANQPNVPPQSPYRPLPAGAVPTITEVMDVNNPRWKENERSELDKNMGTL